MKQTILKILADLRFAIFILLLISIFSIFGTIIEQDQSIEIYKLKYSFANPVLGFLSWNIILKFGLDHVYRTWWFLSLIFIFGLSLILCSFLQQFPSLKIARRCQFLRTTHQFYRLKILTFLNSFSLNEILARIQIYNYSIFQQKSIVYCYKGLIGRLAPIIVHFSMILVLFGTIIGSCFGFKGQEIITSTNSFYIQNLLTKSALTLIPKKLTRVNDFWITYTKQKTVAQFYSDLSIINKIGTEETRKTISVNFPLILNRVYYYQTDWNLLGLRFQNKENKIIEYPLFNILNTDNKIGITFIKNNKISPTGLILLVDNLEGYSSLYDENGQFLETLEINETMNTFPQTLTFIDLIYSTGLQMKTDPGIPIIYLGFFFLITSTLLSYINYAQIWMIKKNKTILIGGNTNRAVFNFELEFLKFVK